MRFAVRRRRCAAPLPSKDEEYGPKDLAELLADEAQAMTWAETVEVLREVTPG